MFETFLSGGLCQLVAEAARHDLRLAAEGLHADGDLVVGREVVVLEGTVPIRFLRLLP